MKRRFLVLSLAMLAKLAFAETSLSPLFSDHMVLQQSSSVAIWGQDKPQQTITIKPSWGGEFTGNANKDGKWRLSIETPSAGGPYVLQITGSSSVSIEDVMLGEVWLASGQSNMEMPLKGFTNQPILHSQQTILQPANSNIRMFTVGRHYSITPKRNLSGSWRMASPAARADFSATAYFFAEQLEQSLGVPIGIIVTSWGGSSLETWMSRDLLAKEGIEALPERIPQVHYLNDRTSKMRVQQIPTLLYNGMLSPLFGYGIKGAIWYQGESNVGRSKEYLDRFPKMVNEWREDWGIGNFPFYYVQIAPYNYRNVNSAFLRESQRLAQAKIPHSAMAITLDSNACNSIHPSDKQTVGKRLSYLALARDYGFTQIDAMGPVLLNSKSTNNVFSINLDAGDKGITSFGKPITGFELAGADQVFHPAKATIRPKESTIDLKAQAVPNPVAARYAFNNCPKYSVYSTFGLPLSSFRTDNW